MHLLGPLLFTLFAIVAVVMAVLFRSGHQAARAAVVGELARRGIRHSALGGDGRLVPGAPNALDAPTFGILLERSDGMRVSLSPNTTQGAATLPGFGPIHPQLTLVEFDLPLPDQMICAHDRAQAVFGPFPPPALRTGHPHFDQRFGIFVRPAEGHGYRPTPSDPAPWARSPSAGALFTDFYTLGFVALHVHGGRGRMLFAPQAVDGLVAALDTGAALARPHEPRAPRRPPTRLATTHALVVLIGVLGSVPMTFGIPFLPHLTETGLAVAGYEVACPRGGTFDKGYRNRSDTCKLPNNTTYRAESSAYIGWQFALWSPFEIGIIAAATAAFYKTRRDAARDVERSLTQR
ncbi:MAG TPA: hypothetical protein VM694_34835 [Polyangium sp.]|nr:hypothetical protein [Polyangium sp.]